MTKITYIEFNGTEKESIEFFHEQLLTGDNVDNIPGIEADCGGACACSTCHVYIDPSWVDKLPAKDDMEEDMLDFAFSPDVITSRLTCQLEVSDAFDGLIVRMPEKQI